MVKERYKDSSLDIIDAGAKVKALINEFLIERGVNPVIPPIELLSEDFISHVHQHSQGSDEAKASEMEHAIRKHCTVHFDEDPAFYGRLSEKLEKLIAQHRDNWRVLFEELEKLRSEVIEKQRDIIVVFYDYVLQLASAGREVSDNDRESIMHLTTNIVNMLRNTINVLDFWEKANEVKALRGNVDTEILLANVPILTENHERLAFEIVQLAQMRHADLTR